MLNLQIFVSSHHPVNRPPRYISVSPTSADPHAHRTPPPPNSATPHARPRQPSAAPPKAAAADHNKQQTAQSKSPRIHGEQSRSAGSSFNISPGPTGVRGCSLLGCSKRPQRHIPPPPAPLKRPPTPSSCLSARLSLLTTHYPLPYSNLGKCSRSSCGTGSTGPPAFTHAFSPPRITLVAQFGRSSIRATFLLVASRAHEQYR